MIEEICGLIFYLVLIAVLSGDNDLSRLLADLFEDLVLTLVEQVVGV